MLIRNIQVRALKHLKVRPVRFLSEEHLHRESTVARLLHPTHCFSEGGFHTITSNQSVSRYESAAIISSEGCELDQMRHGCRIHNAKCKCGHGCKSEYRYNNTDDCELALKGRRSDLCSRSKPCQNEGSCSQISSDPGFKCRCEGTGFYGTYCEIPCPKTNSPHFQGQFPYECIVI
ncbi:hypothetical protein EAI_10847 [Harpegnathos saltator]|uniref:EGF-like domain-containing protein n=1 Tax=Harpegnathos saltator TaxID=610380 RepID=E2B5T3_HARSA|nr:hypothetical protein EAI_10847 [Harpegnathos saltator]